jgi:hypothetical protein
MMNSIENVQFNNPYPAVIDFPEKNGWFMTTGMI